MYMILIESKQTKLWFVENQKCCKIRYVTIGLNRIYANHASDNPASGKVMQKCGMTYEGTMRQALKCNNGLFDKVNYAILADEYNKRML